jgi:predicted phosphoadenosine phosphosulfate sulfurtransferase
MKLSFNNVNKPSNKTWKSISDFFLYSLPLYLGAIMTLPITENQKLWVTFTITILTVTLKGLSKLTSDKETTTIL